MRELVCQRKGSWLVSEESVSAEDSLLMLGSEEASSLPCVMVVARVRVEGETADEGAGVVEEGDMAWYESDVLHPYGDSGPTSSGPSGLGQTGTRGGG